MVKKIKKVKKGVTTDDLAVMVAKGFSRVDEQFSRVDEQFSRVDQRFEDVEKRMATKNDLVVLKNDIDFMLSHHIGTFRKDYDDLAARVKKIEETLFQRR